MVEVWLPYRDIEVPIMLPDPINLRIQPKTVYPSSVERDALEKLRLLAGEKVRPIYSPLSDEVERRFLNRLLRRAGVEIGGDREVYIDIFREDPILGFRSSIWIPILNNLPFKNVLEKAVEGIPKEVPVAIYIDVLLDGGGRLHQVFGSRDGGHFGEARDEYMRGWCLRSGFAPLIIASMGGSPWDESVSLMMSSLTRLAKALDDGATVIVVAALGKIGVEPTRLSRLTVDAASSPEELYIAYAREHLKKINVIHYGSLPRVIANILGISKVRNVESYIQRLPAARKREILVVEDMYLSSFQPCPTPPAEEGEA